ncbi:MAG: hypothetical protein KAJ32_02225 [Gammaproteobacteria bacterium]|nr:hypothetical protein [Gammaproteobacteria bacterium]
MKMIKILFSCLLLSALPLMVVHATEGADTSKQLASAQVETEMTSAERSAFRKSLFEGRCQMCHQLPEPGMLRPNQWRLILATMQQRMQQASVPPLTEDETEMVLEYIVEQSR